MLSLCYRWLAEIWLTLRTSTAETVSRAESRFEVRTSLTLRLVVGRLSEIQKRNLWPRRVKRRPVKTTQKWWFGDKITLLRENFRNSLIKVRWSTPTDVYLPEFHADLSRYKEMRLHNNNNKPICNAPDASVTDPESRRTLRNITVRVDH